MQREEIYLKVAATVAETMCLDIQSVHATSKLCGDLGAESIDIVDLLFRLEHVFRIDIPSSDFNPAAILQQHPEYVQAGRVTEAGLAALRDRLPFADLDAFAENPQRDALYDLFTVETVARYVQARLNCGQ
jgi:acyl carrier protein